MGRYIILLLLFFCFDCDSLKGQNVMSLYGEVDQLFKSSSFQEAKPVLDEIERLTLESKQDKLYLYALSFQAFCDYQLADYKSMQQIAFKANDYFEDWEKQDSTVLSSIDYMIGLSYYELGNSTLAHNYLLSSFQLEKKYHEFGFRKEDILNNLSLCFLDLADYEKVRLYLRKALESTSPLVLDSDRAQWNNLIANTYKKENRFEIADVYYKKALSKIEEIKKSKRKDYALIIMNDYVSFLIKSGKLDEAEKLIIEIELFGVNKANQNNYLQNVANIALFRNEQNTALAIFNNIIARSIQEYGVQHKDVIETYIVIADTYYEKADFVSAQTFSQYSLHANSISTKERDSGHSREYIIPYLGLRALLLKAKSEVNIDYSAAKETISSLVDLLNQTIRSDITIFDSKLHMVNYVRSYFKELIDISLSQGDTEAAFYLCQKSHGLVLDLQVDENLIKSNTLSSRLLKRDQNFKRQLLKFRTDLFEKNQNGDTLLFQKSQSELFDLQYDYDQFTDSLYNHFSQLNNKFSADDHKIEDLQNKLLNVESALVEYFIENNLLYTFCITQDSIFTHQQKLPDNFDDIAGQYITSLRQFSNENFDVFVNSSTDLYTYLLSPVVESFDASINKLHIIPDGILNYISFDALIETVPESLENNRYDLLEYVINSYEIDYNYSSLLYTFENNSISQDLTGFAPSFSSDSTFQDNMSPLIHNIDEILQIKDIIDGDMFIDTSALLGNFVKSVNEYNIAHLATHAICNDSIPMKSSIYFQDKVLNTYEIYNMPNSLDLVVLSACNTGTGKLRKGEGIMSLARAFMASGCNSIVTSLWNVNDRTSVTLMTDFYKELAEGKSVSHSLRTAKLNYIASPSSILDAHPYYWSGFVLLGDDVRFTDNRLIKNLLLIFILVVLLILFFLFIRSRS